VQRWEYLQVNESQLTGSKDINPDAGKNVWLYSNGGYSLTDFFSHHEAGKDRRGRDEAAFTYPTTNYASLLNKMDAEGWELVSILSGSSGVYGMLFKRPKE
jgi:hypothetical protein